jgi:hypothetical protein
MQAVMTHAIRTALILGLLGGLARPASADWLLTPYAGVVFSGGADFGDLGGVRENLERRATFGGSIKWMGAGIIGLELDFGTTPNFYRPITRDSNVTTLMGNLVIGAPFGGTAGPGVRPYVSGGAGLLRSRIDPGDLFDEVRSDDWGINVGAGVHTFFNDVVGLRLDARYFRSMSDTGNGFDFDLGEFDFWRGTVGLTIRLGG